MIEYTLEVIIERLQGIQDRLEMGEAKLAIHEATAKLRRAVRLLGVEEVHHIDGNPHNNDPANLRIVRRRAKA